ncbi:MAG: glutamyl-tRNA reductase [Deferribacteraceae bacterium]|jgi:glutamyl-tRNA reductase|nr:glutamyl-tRNA reductase [Deferribacteraceae bacterium]
MQLSILGLNHNTAPIAVREKLSVPEQELAQAYKKLFADSRVIEATILSTCNRVEYYIVTKEDVDILDAIATSCGINEQTLREHSYIHCGSNALRHMVAVASGIDSLVLGEPQIFGQVKDAFRFARDHGSVHAYINRLEQFVLRTTKKVRTDTGISENAVSVSYAAVDLAKKIFGSLADKRALIIGAGEMCELAVEHLVGAGIGGITVTNRTLSKAEDLARQFAGKAVAFDKFADSLHEADIVISSTGAPVAVVESGMVKRAMTKRKREPMFFIDIAVPRDIAEDVGKLDNVYVYDIDDLKQVVEANRKEREHEATKAIELINGAVIRFEHEMDSLAADPLIVALREQTLSVFEQEFQKYCAKNPVSEEEKEKLMAMCNAMANKLLHAPVKSLKSYVGSGGSYSMAEAARLLFNLEK